MHVRGRTISYTSPALYLDFGALSYLLASAVEQRAVQSYVKLFVRRQGKEAFAGRLAFSRIRVRQEAEQ